MDLTATISGAAEGGSTNRTVNKVSPGREPFRLGDGANSEREWKTSFLRTLTPASTKRGLTGARQRPESPPKSKLFANGYPERPIVEGSWPRGPPRTPNNRTMFSLHNEDIDGSTPSHHGFATTRCHNPLDPVYHLPSAEIAHSPPPKFIRDAINVRDIDGASPSAYWKEPAKRETNFIDDVVGARPKVPRAKLRFGPADHSRLDVSDIQKAKFVSSRETNVLSPRYRYDVPPESFFSAHPEVPYTPSTWVIGDMKGNHPSSPPPARSVDFRLRTFDIEGGQPRGPVERNQWRPINYVGDIEGATKEIPEFLLNILAKQEAIEKEMIKARGGGVKKPVGNNIFGNFPENNNTNNNAAAGTHRSSASKHSHDGNPILNSPSASSPLKNLKLPPLPKSGQASPAILSPASPLPPSQPRSIIGRSQSLPNSPSVMGGKGMMASSSPTARHLTPLDGRLLNLLATTGGGERRGSRASPLASSPSAAALAAALAD